MRYFCLYGCKHGIEPQGVFVCMDVSMELNHEVFFFVWM